MYMVEQYLLSCVESVRRQTLDNIEIILVDDGSPDRCGEIAEQYTKKDSRIKVVHRKNGGLGPARNSGIEVASGKYIGFVDSDDWIEPEMYERLISAAESHQADMAIGGMKIISHGVVKGEYKHPYAGQTFCGEQDIFKVRRSFYGALPRKVKVDPVPISVWRAVYRRSLLEKNHISFLNVRSEDKFFNTHFCRHANRVTCTDGTSYCYRKDDQPSITKTFNRRTSASFYELFDLLETMVEEEPPCYVEECSIRARRCVIDYTRTLISMIENSSEDSETKHELVQEAMAYPALRKACSNYPFWKLPLPQAVFCAAMKNEWAGLARALVRLRRGL